MTTYVYGSARAECSTAGGLTEVHFSGAVSLAAICSLSGQISVGQPQAVACVTYLDRALLLFDWADAARADMAAPRRLVASAIIVRGFDLAATTRYCALMAQSGILRMAFRLEEDQLAWQWALAAGVLASPVPCRHGSIRV